jgi:O-Antigen ligase
VSIVAVRPTPRTAAEAARAQESTERWVRRGVVAVFWLLLANVLTFFPKTWSGQPLILPIPSVLGKAWTQGSLPLALVLAVAVNRRRLIRPNVFLCLVSLLVLGAAIGMLQAEHFGTIYRTFRLAGFVATLWLLTPWFGRRDLLLVRAYLSGMSVVLASVLLGLVLSPSRARGGGRLAGALWPTPPTQVAEFSAVTMGLIIIMWLSGYVRGRIALLIVVPGVFILLETHTRTALLGLVVALMVAGLSLITARARVRKVFAIAAVAVSVAAITLSGFITTWLTRGQDSQQLTDLTGRTDVWSQVLSVTRSLYQVVFGFGLSNKSFNGLSIDSNWLASYYDQGLWGVVVCAAILAFLLVALLFQPRGPMRAMGLFLVVYCLVASFTETGFSDASTYLLELTLAASLLVPAAARSVMDRRLE